MVKTDLLLGVVDELVLDGVLDALLYAAVLYQRRQRVAELRAASHRQTQSAVGDTSVVISRSFSQGLGLECVEKVLTTSAPCSTGA